MLARFDGRRLETEELRRFPNEPVQTAEGLSWDVLGLFRELVGALVLAGRPASVGVDSWGVDFGLIDREGALVATPRHYRDERTDGMVEEACRRVPREELYATTGIQFLPINTLCQLLAMERSPALEAADAMLLIPDLMTFWLTGERAAEATNASTTQLVDVETGDWARGLAERLGIQSRILPPIVEPGTPAGEVLRRVAEHAGVAPGVAVVRVASHDTASAVLAAPASRRDFAYVSCGTWSLVGLELDEPVLSEDALEANLTNERGFGGKVRLLRNVMGLWLVQECRRAWKRAGDAYAWQQLVEMAARAPACGALIDPDRPELLPPGDMPARIRAACEETGQPSPETPGAIVRCVLESLACKYRLVLERIERAAGRRAEVVHLIGGGARNELLCRLSANVCERPVLAGPAEATALGNALVQAHAAGEVGGLTEMRELARASCEVRAYEPDRDPRWDELRRRFEAIVERGEVGAWTAT